MLKALYGRSTLIVAKSLPMYFSTYSPRTARFGATSASSDAVASWTSASRRSVLIWLFAALVVPTKPGPLRVEVHLAVLVLAVAIRRRSSGTGS